MGRVMVKNAEWSMALDLVLRREWAKTFDANFPILQNYERSSFKRMMRTFPKNKDIIRIVKDITAEEKTLEALKNAVQRGNVNTVRKLYHTDFFFQLLKNAKATNATMLNAIVPTRTPPETLIRSLLVTNAEGYPAAPSAIVHIMKTRKVPVETFVNIVADARKKSVHSEDGMAEDVLQVLEAYEKAVGKRLDLKKIPEKHMVQILKDRWEDFDLVNEDIPPMHVLRLLAFMIQRGAPRVPLNDIMRYVLNYMEMIQPVQIRHREVYDVLRLYDREPLKEKTFCGLLRRYAMGNAEEVSSRVREILDHIIIPKNALELLFRAFRKSETSVPDGDVDYLIMRGAERTPKALEAFVTYASKFASTQPELVAADYRTMLRGLPMNNLVRTRAFTNVFKNLVRNVRVSRGLRSNA